MTEHCTLVVPVEGILQVLHSENDIDPAAHIGQVAVSLTLQREGVKVGRVALTGNPSLQVNPRASKLIYSLTGSHVLVTGPAAFSDMNNDALAELVAVLS